MLKPLQLVLGFMIFWLYLLACTATAPLPTETALPSAVIEIPASTAEPTPTEGPAAAPALSFIPATYQDLDAGFAFDYPAEWVADLASQAGGDRGYFAQLTSWQRPPNSLPESVPDGGSIIQVEVLLWDPQNALDQFINQRKIAWDASGFSIALEEEVLLPNDWPAVQFNIVTTEGIVTYYLITTIDTRYLVLSGSGDLALIQEAANTLRLVASQ